MPTVNFKITSFYTIPSSPNNSGGGWSETYYFPAADLQTLFPYLQQFFGKRMAMLAKPASWDAYRVTDLSKPRLSQLFPSLGYTGFDPLVGQADRPGSAALISFQTGTGKNRRLEMRGVPDAIFDYADPGNAGYLLFEQKFVAFKAFLETGPLPGLFIRGLDQVTYPKVQVSNLVYDGTAKTLTITVPAGITIAAGQFVKVYGAPGWHPALNRLQVISYSAGPPGSIVCAYVGQQGPAVTLKTKVMRSEYIFEVVDSVEWLRSTNKKIGRPFNQSRGRAPARR